MKKKILLSMMAVGTAAVLASVLLMSAIAYHAFNMYVPADTGTKILQEAFRRAVPLIVVMMAGMIALCFGAANVLVRRILRPIEALAGQPEEADAGHAYPELAPFVGRIRKQHEEILRSANMRVEFTANVSHELKTPLTSISGYAELIESGMACGEQGMRFAGEIRKSANRLLALINDIIQLSQMDSPEVDVVTEPVNLAPLAASVMQ